MSDRHLLELVRLVGAPLAAEQPWVGWMLVALCRQRARQTWLLEVHERHLAHVDEPRGDVPGLDGWRYDYHGSGLCLAGPGGDVVDMDFHEGPPGQTIDPYFFAHRVRSLEQAHPEARLRGLLPSSDWIAQGLKALRRVGAVHHPTSTHVFRLAARLEHHHVAIAAVDFGSQRVRRRWRAAFGDDEAGLLHTRAWAMATVRAKRANASLLKVHILREEQVETLALELLAGPIDAYLGRGVDALRALGRPPPAALVTLLDRLDPGVHHPYPAHAVVRLLLNHGLERARCLDTLERFARVDVVTGYRGNPYRDHLAVLMARYDAERAWPLYRLAVNDSTPAVHKPIGALLAVMPDERAARVLLEAALASEPTQRRFLLACLAHRPDPASQQLARKHMPAPPERSGTIGYTYEEVAYANLRSSIEAEITKARETWASLCPS